MEIQTVEKGKRHPLKCKSQGTNGIRCRNIKPVGWSKCVICTFKFIEGTKTQRFYPSKYNENLILDLQN